MILTTACGSWSLPGLSGSRARAAGGRLDHRRTGAPRRSILDSVMAFSERSRCCSSWTIASNLLDACTELARLALAMSTSVRILATSRESLGMMARSFFVSRP